MIEGLFWIFISFFAALGILEFFKMLQSFICREETRCNILLVPVGDDSDVDAECRIHTAVADFADAISRHGSMYIVDMGMGEKNRAICSRLCDLYSLQTISLDDLSVAVKKQCRKK